MIYTNNFASNKKSKGYKISIVLYHMGWTSNIDYDKHYLGLAPSPQLLEDYKGGRINWNEYRKRYLEEMTVEKIQGLLDIIKDKEDVTLLCYCSKKDNCHRHIVAEMLNELGYETKEI